MTKKKPRTWTILTITQGGKINQTAGLSDEAVLKIGEIYKHPRHNCPIVDPWPFRAEAEAIKIIDGMKMLDHIRSHFEWHWSDCVGDNKVWYSSDHDINTFCVWSNDGSEVSDLFPAPENYADMIVAEGMKLIEEVCSEARQTINWFEDNKRVPWNERPYLYIHHIKGGASCWKPRRINADKIQDGKGYMNAF